MKFISYAQNFEDVMLWRALRGVSCGTYIDVGAAWPEQDSVTRAFYRAGWSGINIDPNPAFHDQLVRERPRDINLCLAISDFNGSGILSLIPETGLSTLNLEVAGMHERAHRVAKALPVEVRTLASVWRDHLPKDRPVAFLKVDVEGAEAAVLRGNDWQSLRPWLVVVEATVPESAQESFDEWEPFLIAADYSLCYADGLNRFYVASEKKQALLPAFRYPPNVFDEFVVAPQVAYESWAKEAEERSSQFETWAKDAQQRGDQFEAWAKDAQQRADQFEEKARHLQAQVTVITADLASRTEELRALKNSVSWRMTRPLRRLAARFLSRH
jgi:FkbM family methyltransferase